MKDLSQPVYSGMMVYPGDPQVRLEPGLTLQEDGVAVAELSCGSHTGTHLDAPCHSVLGGRTISQISLQEICGPALVLALDAQPRETVGAETVERLLRCVGSTGSLPAMVFLAFGWDQFFGTLHAYEHPALSRDAAELLWERGMRVLGTDALSPDLTGGKEVGAPTMPVHEFLLGTDGLIAENLTGLREFAGEVIQVGIFPLPLAAADGAPARIVAL